MSVCLIIYLASIWAGNSKGYGGEDLGRFMMPALLSVVGFFAIPIIAFVFSFFSREKH
jgi:hypothetical protein